MKCIKHDLGTEARNIEIVSFFDLHIGSPACDMAKIKEMINYVKDNPNAYAICGGDLINNSTKTSVGDPFAEELSPMEQMYTAIDLFTPIKDKILGMCSGNHENRSYKNDGVDLMGFFAKCLGLSDIYDSVACLLFLRFGQGGNHSTGKQCYTVYFSHGDGIGGRLAGSKANGLQRRGEIVNADVIIAGHHHQPIVFTMATNEIDYANSSIKHKEQLFVGLSATLNQEAYAERVGLRPSSKAQARVILNGVSQHQVMGYLI